MRQNVKIYTPFYEVLVNNVKHNHLNGFELEPNIVLWHSIIKKEWWNNSAPTFLRIFDSEFSGQFYPPTANYFTALRNKVVASPTIFA
jgi:hypothetical protein